MKRSTQIELMKQVLRQKKEKFTADAGVQAKIPVTDFTCPELAKKEWQTLFCNYPQLLGLSGDIPACGEYITSDIYDTPIIGMRDKHGKFRAYVNACAHRGAKVLEEKRGKVTKLTCPFHGWNYSTEGKLIGVSYEKDFGRVDRSCNSLVELPAVEKYGLLLVHLNKDGEIDADEFVAGLGEEFMSWGIDKMRYVCESSLETNANWKICHDTYGETYHVNSLHPDTVSNIAATNNMIFDTFGYNHRLTVPSCAIDLLDTMDESQWPTSSIFILYSLFPNSLMTVGEGRVSMVRIFPDKTNPLASKTIFTEYVNEEVSDTSQNKIKADNLYDADGRKNTTEALGPEAMQELFRSTVKNEDYRVCETAQVTASTGRLTHFTYGRNEPGLLHTHNCFRRALEMPLLETIKTVDFDTNTQTKEKSLS